MKLKVIQSDSRANCYILEGKNSALIIECGVSYKRMQKAIDYNIQKVVGCLITHEHGDHSKHFKQYIDRGIHLFTSEGTKNKLVAEETTRVHALENRRKVIIGEFTVIPFDVRHNAAEPFGYIISHKEAGNILFAIDTYYIPYKFDNLNYVIIEANYKQEILDYNVEQGNLHPLVRKNVMRGHMEIKTLCSFFDAIDKVKINQIVLVHLSSNNSTNDFKDIVERRTGKPTVIAERDTVVEMNIKSV